MRFNSKVGIIGTLVAVMFSLLMVLPVLGDDAGTAVTLVLKTNADVDDFVSNTSAADNTVTVTVHDPAKKGVGGSTLIEVTVESNDD